MLLEAVSERARGTQKPGRYLRRGQSPSQVATLVRWGPKQAETSRRGSATGPQWLTSSADSSKFYELRYESRRLLISRYTVSSWVRCP
jgi:hypothetical protein